MRKPVPPQEEVLLPVMARDTEENVVGCLAPPLGVNALEFR